LVPIQHHTRLRAIDPSVSTVTPLFASEAQPNSRTGSGEVVRNRYSCVPGSGAYSYTPEARSPFVSIRPTSFPSTANSMEPPPGCCRYNNCNRSQDVVSDTV